MPYSIKKQGQGFAIVNRETGKVVGHSKTKQQAQASVRARYAGESKKK